MLKEYFQEVLKKVEASDIQNDGKDENGFYKPTRTLLLRHLNLLIDLHDKPRAKEMVKTSWKFVVENIPPEFLILTPDQKTELKKLLS